MTIKIGNLEWPPRLDEMERVAQEDYDRFAGTFAKSIERIGAVRETQAAIIPYIEEMARVMAEAGRASEKAVGDPATAAIDKWVEVLRTRAKELLREDKQKKLEPPTIESE